MNPENRRADEYDPLALAAALRNASEEAESVGSPGFVVTTRMARWIADRLDPIKEE